MIILSGFSFSAFLVNKAVASACRRSVVDFQSAQSLIRVSSAGCVYTHVHLTSSGKSMISEEL